MREQELNVERTSRESANAMTILNSSGCNVTKALSLNYTYLLAEWLIYGMETCKKSKISTIT